MNSIERNYETCRHEVHVAFTGQILLSNFFGQYFLVAHDRSPVPRLICRLFLLFRRIVSDRAIASIYLERTVELVCVTSIAMEYLDIERSLAVGTIYILLTGKTARLHRLPHARTPNGALPVPSHVSYPPMKYVVGLKTQKSCRK